MDRERRTLYFELVGVLWFFLYVKRRLRAGLAGPPVADHMEPPDQEESAVARESIGPLSRPGPPSGER